MGEVVVTLAAVCLLASVHLLAGRLRFLGGVPRSRWLSFAGGVSIAYVVVRILPELSAKQETIDAPANELIPFLEYHVYLLTLAGLVAFYGVERMSLRSRARRRQAAGEDVTDAPAFWVSVATFATYNAIIGYVVADFDESPEHSLTAFVAALAVHFLVNDYGLQEHHKHLYERIGRWVLAAAVLGGWVLGRVAELSPAAIAMLVALLAGGILLNTFKEELPAERESRFAPFLVGAVAYAALLELV